MSPGDHAVMNSPYLPSSDIASLSQPGNSQPGNSQPGPSQPSTDLPGAGPCWADTFRPAPWRWIALIAAVAVAVEMAVSARYGYHRDELYFLAAGQHPAFGYVDQPPLTPLLARLSAVVSGNSLVILRLIPALGLAALIALTAAMSRLLGAGRTGQVLAALATATCGEYLADSHLLTTTTLDFVFWAVTLLLVLKLITTGDRRWWVAIGACAGVGAEAKWNIGFLVAALAVGFAATPARKLAASRWLLLGAALAVALAAPDVVWQAAHGWPAFDVFGGLQQDSGQNRVTYWPAQIVYTGLALTPVWVAGLAWTLRSAQARRFRSLGIACAVAIAVFFVLGGKPYYPGAVFTFLFAAGAVPLERWLAARRPLAGVIRPAVLMGVAMVAVSAVALPIAVPVLPARVLHSVPLQNINYDLAETIAWPQLVARVAREYHALPPALRARTAIITGNYGEAGAIDRFGPADGLPTAYSGANNFWLWGPPPARDDAAIAVNVDPALLRREYAGVRQIGTFENGLGVSDDEQGTTLYLATGLRSGWNQAWPQFRNYS
jgi:Dolichyl-phosphate-mannose-protein mannosyltransferase